MKITLWLAAMILLFSGCTDSAEYQPRNGDIIFQTSESAQSRGIQLATHSPYSHMGIVYVENGQAMVFEAVGPVKITPLADWIARGKNQHFVVKRLKNADEVLTPETLDNMKDLGKSRYLDRPYDQYFEWSGDRIYCSELVWKIYNEGAGIRVGNLQKLGDFDISHPEVQKLMNEKYGDSPPLEEPVVSPAAMFDSELIELVYKNEK